MIDTHAHLTDSDFDSDREEVIKRAQDSGVKKIICVLCEFNEKNTLLFKELLTNDCIWGAVGVHPHDAEDYEKYSAQLFKILDLPKVVALGEIGLDYHYKNPRSPEATSEPCFSKAESLACQNMHSPKEIQRQVFEKQLLLAGERNLPVIIHSREASDDCYDILKKFKPAKGIMHCFSGSEKEAEEYLSLGFYLSFAGPVTFPKGIHSDKNAVKPKEVIKTVPEDRLLLETDCPYLAPQVFRGKRNEPAYIKYIYEEVARLRNVSTDGLAGTVLKNAAEVFGV